MSKYGKLDLADRFIQMSEKFLEIHKARKTRLNFLYQSIVEEPCGTVACHGGFAFMALNAEKELLRQTFQTGAERLAEFLGFNDAYALECWAEDFPDIWGNQSGAMMFGGGGRESFVPAGLVNDADARQAVTLLTIAQWYANVAARLLGVEPKAINYGGNNV